MNDDGKINLWDKYHMDLKYGTFGEPINKTALLLELMNRIDSLNASVIELNNTVNQLLIRLALVEGLVSHWKLDEGTGTLAYDSSGRGNNGILINGPLWVDGKCGKALSFDGIDDCVSIPDSPSLRVQTFTLEAWIYMTKRPYEQGNPNSAIINKLHWWGGCAGYKLQFESPSSTDDDLVVSIGDGPAQRFLVRYNSTNDLTLNDWHHVVGTYDGYTANIYIDGELKSTADPGYYTILHDDSALMIGAEYYYWGCHYGGLIDNALVYNRALSPEEVLSHYLNPP
jgi:hypothetical protein